MDKDFIWACITFCFMGFIWFMVKTSGTKRKGIKKGWRNLWKK